MRRKKFYATSNWWILVAIATIIMGVSNWVIASAIGACVGSAILICGLLYIWRKRKQRENELADLCDLLIEQGSDFYASNELQHVHITLLFKANTDINVTFIGISFRDMNDNVIDIIQELSDWNRKGHRRPDSVKEPWGTNEGIWHWTYDDDHRRKKGQRITICIQFRARKPFNGQLRVGVSCLEIEKVLYLPFEVKEK